MNTPKKLAFACALVALPLAACGDDEEDIDDLDDIEVTVDDGGAVTTIGGGAGDPSMPAMTTAPAVGGTDAGGGATVTTAPAP